jgi:hypothetical protein
MRSIQTLMVGGKATGMPDGCSTTIQDGREDCFPSLATFPPFSCQHRLWVRFPPPITHLKKVPVLGTFF